MPSTRTRTPLMDKVLDSIYAFEIEHPWNEVILITMHWELYKILVEEVKGYAERTGDWSLFQSVTKNPVNQYYKFYGIPICIRDKRHGLEENEFYINGKNKSKISFTID